MLALTGVLAIITCLLFDLAPALRATGTCPGAVLNQFCLGISSTQERFATQRMLVAAQIALSLVLLIGALLFTGSRRNLLHVNTGFDTHNILTVDFRFARAAPLKTSVPEYQRFD